MKDRQARPRVGIGGGGGEKGGLGGITPEAKSKGFDYTTVWYGESVKATDASISDWQTAELGR